MQLLRPATRKIVGALGAAAIALGAIAASALPARADSDDVMRAIAGVAAIAIIGSALNDNDGHRRGHGYGPVMRPEPPRPHPGWHQPRPQHPGWHHPQPPRQTYHRHDRCGPYGCDRHDRRDSHGRHDRHDRAPHHPSR